MDRRHFLRESGCSALVCAAGLAGVSTWTTGCASSGAGQSPPGAPAQARQEGPREWVDACRFFDAASAQPMSWDQVLQRLAQSPIVLLGEEHDAVAHHAVRGRLLARWVNAYPDRPAAIVFEHFDREYRADLERATRPGSALSGLEERLDAGHFDRRGWQWPLHRPLFEPLIHLPVPWVAANLSRAAIGRRQDARGAPGGDDAQLDALVESAAWDPQAQRSLESAVQDGHCGMLGAAALARTVRAQRWRDAALAQALRDARERRVALVAGNGHVRRDHGVPRYLGQGQSEHGEPMQQQSMQRGSQARVVGFEQVDATQWPTPDARSGSADALAALVGDEHRERIARGYDIVCLTLRDPQRERDDPCAGLGAHGSLR